MKHMFHLIPRGSSNTVVQDTGLKKKMRKSLLVTMLLAILVTSSMLAHVEAGVSASNQYVMPGDIVELIFTGTPGSNFTVSIMNTRALMENVSLVFDETGQYTWRYTVNETAPTDSIRVRALIDGEVEYTEFMVSKMTPAQLANTLRIMATSSKKQAETALIEAKRKGYLDTDMVSSYQMGSQSLVDSKIYAEQGENTKAFESIKDALSHFESIIDGSYLEGSPPEQTVNEKALVRAQEVVNELKKVQEELITTSNTLKRKGFDVSVLENRLNGLSSSITSAENALETGELEKASTEIQTATQSQTQIKDALRNRLQELNRARIQNYQQSLVKRYTSMRNTLTALQSVDSERINGVLTNLNSIDTKLDQAQQLYQNGNYVESVRALQIADTEFKDTFYELNGNRTRYLLGSLDKLALELENEPTLENKQRIRNRMNDIETTLRNRLQYQATETTRPPARKTPVTTAPTATP